MKRALLAAAVVILAAGCGGDDEPPSTDTSTTAPTTLTAPARVYWLQDGKVWPAARDPKRVLADASAALGELFEGPTEQEETELGFTTAIPDGIEDAEVSIDDGLAAVQLDVQLLDEALARRRTAHGSTSPRSLFG